MSNNQITAVGPAIANPARVAELLAEATPKDPE